MRVTLAVRFPARFLTPTGVGPKRDARPRPIEVLRWSGLIAQDESAPAIEKIECRRSVPDQCDVIPIPSAAS